ncbi:MAG: M14 family metallopeptidase [Imperialibacter sp.]|uniref:M14 family metallopeptidase n=1 Tax=Imperialibacter sp. TaxID=2038411 RepID=UPI0032ECE5E7
MTNTLLCQLPKKATLLAVAFQLTISSLLLAQIPAPEETLGFNVGADFHLATYEQSLEYFNKLDAASDRIQMVHVGETSEGRPWYFALISSPENLKNIDKYKAIAQRLAHPDGMTREEAKQLAKEGKPIVHIDGGLHASEVAGAQHTISLAHQLISTADTDERITRILDDVIILLWPSLNPDGQDIIANWYAENVGTPYEVAPVPWLYQKYVGHDNNRDAYMVNMIESRVVGRTWREWEPNIIHVHHQSSPFPTRIWLPPFAEPIASQTPPLVAREVNMIGMAMAQELETEGLKGAVHMGQGFDAWYPGYIDYMPVLQNIPSFWTETALYRYATPYFYTISDFPKDRSDLRIESLYSSPWPGGWWRISDAIQYMQTASIAVLDYASKYSETVLFNKYQSAQNTIEKYRNEPPYAYFIPQQQRDPARPVELLKRLAFNGIKISQLDKAITFEGQAYAKGTWVIPMDQEFAELARQVLDVQVYPDLREFPDGPLEQPYDAAGWSLPLQFELNITAAASPLSEEVRASLTEVKGTIIDWKTTSGDDNSKVDFAPGAGFNTNEVAAGILPLPGFVKGSGTTLLLDPKENNIFRVLGEAWKQGLTVEYANQKYAVKGATEALAKKWVDDFAVNIVRTGSSSGVRIQPRIAIYEPWTASMDMGWTRWLLDNFGLPYTVVRNSDFAAGSLKDRFDVIVMASERNGSIENGYKKGQVPPRYEGGLGETGIRNLDDFVKAGGTLVCMNQSSDFAIESLYLPVKNVVKGVNRKDFFTGGSIMEVTTNTTHPVMAGMPDHASVFVNRSPVFTTLEGFKGEALAKYQDKGSPLRSGFLLGTKYLNGYAAGLDVQHGQGHVILFGFQPQWRGQPMGTYRTLFNAMLYGANTAKSRAVSEGFWAAPAKAEGSGKASGGKD